MNVFARSFRFLLLSAFVVIAVSCAGAGKKWDTTHVNDIQNGVHDKAQIKAWFGEPYQVTHLAQHPMNCTERWTYMHAWANWGGAQTTSNALVVDFDDNGIVCEHAYVNQ